MFTRRRVLHLAATGAVAGITTSCASSLLKDPPIKDPPTCSAPTFTAAELGGMNAPQLLGTPILLAEGANGGTRCAPPGFCGDLEAEFILDYTRYDDIDVHPKLISATTDPLQRMWVQSKVWGDDPPRPRPWDEFPWYLDGQPTGDWLKKHTTSGNPQTRFRFHGLWAASGGGGRNDKYLAWRIDGYDNGFLLSFGGSREGTRCNERLTAFALMPTKALPANVSATKINDAYASLSFG
jgi:hypothetical protein